jgi:hypothetical protein
MPVLEDVYLHLLAGPDSGMPARGFATEPRP